MGEFVMTTVTIGGPLVDGEAVAGLAAAVGRYFGEADRLVDEALVGGTRLILEDLQDHGMTPDLDAYCQAHGLTYKRAWCARSGVFEAGLRHWRPGLAYVANEAADDAGEPMITLAALRNAHEAGKTLSDLLARLDEAASSAVPPLRLLGAGGDTGTAA
ncbi:hypothetical protein SAMN04487843_13122 [Methylobacterium sp. ap11]|uniref:hypothetical protein n=1 Tax=Methylobacterium sp. ap11 TaxID=1761799 RepID=UPI0008D3E0A9|nr:hypothetical protein [Methylobacterium sp. ap11]SEP49533.1 hypothetical protein SAMN04487843_13122 [Methylobacterium sp. ap11]